MRICPSILEYKAEDYLATINKLSTYFNYFQLDFTDGIYVDNITANLDDFINLINFQTLKTYTFDLHLMVKDYEKNIKKLEDLKNKLIIKNVFIHYDLFPNSSLFTSHFSFFSIGLVLNPQDQISDLATHYNLQDIPSIQIMSVIPGAQGKPYVPETLKKVEQLHIAGYRSNIFLDGAINDKTLPVINDLKYKPNFICPGSYLTKAVNDELTNRVKYLLSFK